MIETSFEKCSNLYPNNFFFQFLLKFVRFTVNIIYQENISCLFVQYFVPLFFLFEKKKNQQQLQDTGTNLNYLVLIGVIISS